MEDWKAIYDNPQQRHQWKQHRSAYCVAEFLLERNGDQAIQARAAEVLGQGIKLEKAIPEYEVRFDRYGRGRVHDIGVFGRTESGQKVFVGVEAKVDEPFGPTLHDAYLEAKAKRIVGISTKAPERIEQLLALHFTEPDPTMFDVKYQLLYATAGTIAAEADIHLLYVIVFKTPLYDESVGRKNYRDYIHFVNKADAVGLPLDPETAIGHKLNLGGKELICIHEYFQL